MRCACAAAGAGGVDTVFLPTGCMALLEALCAARPQHCLLAADFDALPETRIPGKNAPLVATTVSRYGPTQLAQVQRRKPVPGDEWLYYYSPSLQGGASTNGSMHRRAARPGTTTPSWCPWARQTSSSPRTLPCWSACTSAWPRQLSQTWQVSSGHELLHRLNLHCASPWAILTGANVLVQAWPQAP